MLRRALRQCVTSSIKVWPFRWYTLCQNTQGGYFGNALQAASFSGHEKLIQPGGVSRASCFYSAGKTFERVQGRCCPLWPSSGDHDKTEVGRSGPESLPESIRFRSRRYLTTCQAEERLHSRFWQFCRLDCDGWPSRCQRSQCTRVTAWPLDPSDPCSERLIWAVARLHLRPFIYVYFSLATLHARTTVLQRLYRLGAAP